MKPRTDLFGRTEAEIEKSLARWKGLYAIARGWPDPEGRKTSVYLGNGAADEVALKQLRGEPVDWKHYGYDGPPRPILSGQALRDWRDGLVRRGPGGRR